MSTDLFAPVATGTQRIDLPKDGITIWVYPTVTTWSDHLPNHRDAAVGKCARLYSRRREAQTAYAKHLIDLVHDVRRGAEVRVPADMEADVREVCEAIAIDEARRQIVRQRALAEVARRGLRPVAGA